MSLESQLYASQASNKSDYTMLQQKMTLGLERNVRSRPQMFQSSVFRSCSG